MTRRRFGAAAGIGSVAASLAASGTSDAPLAIGSRRELFVDHELIAEMRGSELRPGIPVDAGVALTLDRPWEGSFCGYTTILPNGWIPNLLPRCSRLRSGWQRRRSNMLRRISRWQSWTRPDLNLFEVRGSKTNNVVWAHNPPFSHNFTPDRYK